MERTTNGAAVRAIREAVGISGRDFAARVGISSGYLSQVEAGAKRASPVLARRIADTLGVPLDAVTHLYPVVGEQVTA